MTSKTDRLEELLVLRATQPLSSAERAELELLLSSELAADAEVFDRVAAAVHVAAMQSRQTLPARLRARLERQAARHFAKRNSNSSN